MTEKVPEKSSSTPYTSGRLTKSADSSEILLKVTFENWVRLALII